MAKVFFPLEACLVNATERQTAYAAGELPLARALRTGQQIEDEDLWIRRADRSLALVSTRAAPLRDLSGVVVGAVATWVDVTEPRRATRALEEESRLRDRFVAVLGHDLRGPLTTVLVSAELLYRAPDSTHGEALRRFSGVGYLLVAGVAASGLVNVWALVGQWPDPRTSTFGLVLTIKLLLVAGMLALALLNRVALAFREKRLLALRRSVVLEWVCGLAAVAVVSLLGTLSPAG